MVIGTLLTRWFPLVLLGLAGWAPGAADQIAPLGGHWGASQAWGQRLG